MNIWDILIIVLLAVVLVRGILRLRKNRGGCSCGSGNCSGCSGGKNCPGCTLTAGMDQEKNDEERR